MCEKPKADYKKLNMCITAPRLQRLWWCLLLRAAMLLLATPTTPPGDDYEMHRYGVVFDGFFVKKTDEEFSRTVFG